MVDVNETTATSGGLEVIERFSTRSINSYQLMLRKDSVMQPDVEVANVEVTIVMKVAHNLH